MDERLFAEADLTGADVFKQVGAQVRSTRLGNGLTPYIYRIKELRRLSDAASPRGSALSVVRTAQHPLRHCHFQRLP